MSIKKYVLSLCFVFAAAVILYAPGVEAATLEYSTETVNNSSECVGDNATITCVNYFTRVVIEGDSEVAENINAVLKQSSDDFFSSESGIFEYAAGDVETAEYDDSYFDYVIQSVCYNGKIISVREDYYWYAGGVTNIATVGYTFSTSSGKEVTKITSVTKTKKLSKIRKSLKKKILASDENLDRTTVCTVLKEKTAKDYDFYVDTDGKVVVCFQPYELGYGGWTREFTLKGKFS
ncbi:MAG: hypothetical protein K6G40_04260 [Eubacterium sp.]|nr:hypothetical protein [Eubacterium sp.]